MESVTLCNKYIAIDNAQKVLKYSQTCPTGNPYRCIASGECVNSAFQCLRNEMLSFTSQFYGQSFSGSFIDSHCTSDFPIRCIDGSCVANYQSCISDEFNATVLANPIAWGASYEADVTTYCQVYC